MYEHEAISDDLGLCLFVERILLFRFPVQELWHQHLLLMSCLWIKRNVELSIVIQVPLSFTLTTNYFNWRNLKTHKNHKKKDFSYWTCTTFRFFKKRLKFADSRNSSKKRKRFFFPSKASYKPSNYFFPFTCFRNCALLKNFKS